MLKRVFLFWKTIAFIVMEAISLLLYSEYQLSFNIRISNLPRKPKETASLYRKFHTTKKTKQKLQLNTKLKNLTKFSENVMSKPLKL